MPVLSNLFTRSHLPKGIEEHLMEVSDVKSLTELELRSHLITCDYKGKDFKTAVLDELLKREFERGLNACRIMHRPEVSIETKIPAKDLPVDGPHMEVPLNGPILETVPLPTSGPFFKDKKDFQDFREAFEAKNLST